MIFRRDIQPREYAAYYEPYINTVSGDTTMVDALESSLVSCSTILQDIIKPMDYRYGDDKWTIGQLVSHCIDTERIFNYRALAFLRDDAAMIPGFDQDIYANSLNDYAFAKAELLKSMKVVRAATLDLFTTANPMAMLKTGVASDNIMSVRAIPFIIAGHYNHHFHILKERY
ncbi:DinB family protein [Nonlabens ponticola]|uniref:DinB family protein n=1 Tax=Nonlabens ponticola TaxID=2496866 RepID=A0A3S9MYE6_9FLAO|nr:DinB family protein [Nonlabens ponticola]AZQ44172.1 DinB family protein [Nonlabens ponticola]